MQYCIAFIFIHKSKFAESLLVFDLLFQQVIYELLRLEDGNLRSLEVLLVARDDIVDALAHGREILHGILEVGELRPDAIVNGVSELLEDLLAYKRMSQAVNPYGDGKACQRIVSVLCR